MSLLVTIALCMFYPAACMLVNIMKNNCITDLRIVVRSLSSLNHELIFYYWKIQSLFHTGTIKEKRQLERILTRMHRNLNCFEDTSFRLKRIKHSQTITWRCTQSFPCRQLKCLLVEYFLSYYPFPTWVQYITRCH